MKIDDSVIRLVSVISGGVSIYLGYMLFLKGVTGQASISVDTSTLSGQIINAAPGLFFALSGVVIIVVALIKKKHEIILNQDYDDNMLKSVKYENRGSSS